jgi:phosphatidylglycerophosphate synthase
MSSRAGQIVIDARPRGPHGLLATEVVMGKSVLHHLLDLTVEHVSAGKAVVVHARGDEHEQLRELAAASVGAEVMFVTGPPRADAVILRTDRLYDRDRLRRGLRRGRSPESAVVWRLDQPESLSTAEQELTRRLSYQPLGKYWAFPLARRLAKRLCPTSVRPNALTLAAATLMLSAAALVALVPDSVLNRVAYASFLALALVLDTADGRLARLQGTSSALGRWLDQVLDELADMALHGAIAWAAYLRDRQALWLVVGIIYASGKYLFVIQSLLGDELERSNPIGTAPAASPVLEPVFRRGRRGLAALAAAVRLMGHADLRWHLWIVLALVGRLDWALALYAAYFPARALAGALRKGVRYA